MTKKIILGTVQLGLAYGINNTHGQPSPDQASALLATAYALGIRCLDTAEAYGSSQAVIGQYHRSHVMRLFSVITKYDGTAVFTGQDFRDRFLQNLEVLQVDALKAYLFHNFTVYQQFAQWPELRSLAAEGRVEQIGVSVYTNEEALQAAADDHIQVIQLPFNLLDNLGRRGDVLRQLKEQGKEVHTRSVFLQGLFHKNRASLGRLAPLRNNLEQLDTLARDQGTDIGTLALAYALRQPLIGKVLIGVETEAQLLENIRQVQAAAHLNEGILEAVDAIKADEPALLNPTNWK
jgi:uncharacterized protein